MLQYNYNTIHTILNTMCKLPRGPSSIADDTCDNYNKYNTQRNWYNKLPRGPSLIADNTCDPFRAPRSASVCRNGLCVLGATRDSALIDEWLAR